MLKESLGLWKELHAAGTTIFSQKVLFICLYVADATAERPQSKAQISVCRPPDRGTALPLPVILFIPTFYEKTTANYLVHPLRYAGFPAAKSKHNTNNNNNKKDITH